MKKYENFFLGSSEDIALEHLDHMSSSIDYSLLNIFLLQ